ncbi:methyl-accepting chemotaxis protein [Janthinobacterium sp. PC23-8]|uniref:methyl-accepting chemotaxis protein n=1 Tax=Janthinobacterium sp. PC23-8 TaxID=2012679 RepID=UPI0026B5650D|nr:methyl-accepting chemotaxis protein [Janthinobacterium sp. PC23-8]
MKHFGIAKKLYVFSSILILLLALLAAMSWSRLGDAGQLAKDAGLVKVRQLQLISSTELSVTTVLLQIRQALIFRDAEKINAALQQIRKEKENIAKNDAVFDSALPTQQARVAFQIWLDMQKLAWPVVEENMRIVAAGDTEQGIAFLTAKTIPELHKMQAWLDTERANQGSYLAAEVAQIESLADATRTQLSILTLCIAAGLMIFSWYISRLLRERIAVSQQVAERVRDGDLFTRQKDDKSDEFSPLLAALAAMQESLATVVGTVRENAELVALASKEIAQGNIDLSQRTESQASALEETSASMEELGSTAQQNVVNAAEANRLAINASEVATAGGAVVANVVSTMKNINESSKEISLIVSVIDGLAFQTNILSLNAAVEAARAGEQGRGFAVVASEVRSLAQRSAEAAKQIKTLIETSVARVEQGVILADEAGTTMGKIVSSIRDVTNIMVDISTAGAEQGSSVAQVSQAIVELDATTQQNAALVEESSAAAENLKIQAEQLVGVVAIFRLGQNGGGNPALASRPSAAKARRATLKLPLA